MQRDLLVGSSAMGKSGQDPEGEWPSLEFSNWLLDQRFGARKRPYLQHFAKAFSSPLMEEVAAIWGEELTGVSRQLGISTGVRLLTIFYSLPRYDSGEEVMAKH